MHLTLFNTTRWVGGEWGECSVSCGEGEQTREILCRQEITPTLTMTVAEGACLTPPSPLLQRTRSCQRPPCPGPGTGGQWSVGAWSQVSAQFEAMNVRQIFLLFPFFYFIHLFDRFIVKY